MDTWQDDSEWKEIKWKVVSIRPSETNEINDKMLHQHHFSCKPEPTKASKNEEGIEMSPLTSGFERVKTGTEEVSLLALISQKSEIDI